LHGDLSAVIALEVVKQGMFTTVQDIGRYGYLRYGVPISGAMDVYSLITTNMLVLNDAGAACIETTLIGPQLEAKSNLTMAVTGGDCSPEVDGSPIPMWQTVTMKAGEVLSFGPMKSGCRAYVAIHGGIDVPIVLGSKSTYMRGGFGGLYGRRLKAGDLISAFDVSPLTEKYSFSPHAIPSFPSNLKIGVVMGPQNEMFTDQGIDTFLSNVYTVTSESDRMGYRLHGPLISHIDEADIVSDALLPGAVQVPQNGMPIVIMKDAQTSGGYPKIAVVTTPDINLLGQAKPNDTIEFSKVTQKQARNKYLQYEKRISDLRKIMVRI
jgi:antagonist of KipI